MGIFSKLFGGAKPPLPSIDHPVFGRMDATLDCGEGIYFWETSFESAATAYGQVSVFCDAPASGPLTEQVEQFTRICEAFADLEAASRPMLIDRLRDFGLEDRADDLKWSSVTLASDGSMTSHWEFTFQTSNSGPLLNVNYENGVPKFVTADN